MLSLEERRARIRRSTWESFISSVLMILFAFILLFKSNDIISSLVLVIGCIGMVLGSLHILRYLRLEEPLKSYSNDIFDGVIMIVFGAIAILKNFLLADMITFILGVYLIYKNAGRLQISVGFQSKDSHLWIYLMIMSIINIIMGVLIVLNPFGTLAITTLIAICVIASEVINMIQNVFILVGLRKTKESSETNEKK